VVGGWLWLLLVGCGGGGWLVAVAVVGGVVVAGGWCGWGLVAENSWFS